MPLREELLPNFTSDAWKDAIFRVKEMVVDVGAIPAATSFEPPVFDMNFAFLAFKCVISPHVALVAMKRSRG